MLRSRFFLKKEWSEGYLGLPGGGVQGIFSEILLCKYKKSRTAHLMSEPYIVGVMWCFVSLKMLPVSHTVNIHEN